MSNTISHIQTPSDFVKIFPVSRETLEKLESYAELLKLWQKSKNLVSSSTLDSLWLRHFVDSAQLIECAPDNPKIWLDFGSGAGFPGLVIAILGQDSHYSGRFSGPFTVHLVESNTRKCAFLHEVARKLELSASGFVEIHNCRIETLHESAQDITPNIVTARALASLEELLGFTKPFFTENTCGLFLKGRELESEIKTAQKRWRFSYNITASQTDSDGKIIQINNLQSI